MVDGNRVELAEVLVEVRHDGSAHYLRINCRECCPIDSANLPLKFAMWNLTSASHTSLLESDRASDLGSLLDGLSGL